MTRHEEELQALRVKKASGALSDDEFNQSVARVIREAAQDWTAQRASGALDENDYEKTKKKIGEIITHMDPAGRAACFSAMSGTALLEGDAYAEGVKLSIQYLFAFKDALKNDGKEFTQEARSSFNRGLKEISKMLDGIPPDVRVQALTGLEDETAQRLLATLPPAQQLRFKRELLTAKRR